MESRNILILPLPLLWYLSDFLFDWLGNQRVTSIIRPGNSELISEEMGGGFPAMFQDLSISRPMMMATLLLVRPLWHGSVVMPWWIRRFPQGIWGNGSICRTFYKIIFLEQLKI